MLKYLNLKFSYSLSLVHNEESTLPNCLNSTHYKILAALLGHTHFKQEEIGTCVIRECRSLIGADRISLSFALQPSLNKFGTFKQLNYLFSVSVKTDEERQMFFLVRCQCLEYLLFNIIERCMIIDRQNEFLGSIYKASREVFDGYLVLFLSLWNRKAKHVERIKCN